MKDKFKGKGNILFQMAPIMMENGKMISKMDKEYKYMKAVGYMKVKLDLYSKARKFS